MYVTISLSSCANDAGTQESSSDETTRATEMGRGEFKLWKDQPSLDAQGSIDAGSALPGRTASLSSTKQASFDAHQPPRRFRGTSVGHSPSYL